MLESKASNKTLRINNGDVEGRGGRGRLAQFYVHMRRPGVVALQNVNNTNNWLAIHNHQLIGTVSLELHAYIYIYTVKPPIKDTPKEDKPPNKGQAESTLVYTYTPQKEDSLYKTACLQRCPY